MIDTCPMNKTKHEILTKIHVRQEEMDRKGEDFYDSIVKLREEIYANLYKQWMERRK